MAPPLLGFFAVAPIGRPAGALVENLIFSRPALSRGRRDFDSVAGLSADRYEVLVDDEVASEAARLLGDRLLGGPKG
jgi:hypothetical protein